jgi:hypothetical protein
MSIEDIWDQIKNPVVKFLIPAMLGVSINLAIQARKKVMSKSSIITAFIFGISVAWLLSPVINSVCSEDYQGLCIGIVALSGDKIALWAYQKANIDRVVELFIEWLKR